MKPKLLIGRPGVGKTYSVEQKALKGDYFLIEYNSSDSRTAESLKTLSASQKIAVTGKKQMYLFDEVDSMDKGGAKRLAKFLNQASEIPVFLTANEEKKISKLILAECEIIHFEQKEESEIAEILNQMFPDCIGLGYEEFIEKTKEAAANCEGDIRKARQFILYNRSENYNRSKYDALKAVKMIFFEPNRRKVFEYIKQIPISSLYSWIFESFAIAGDKKTVGKLSYLNTNIYKLNETYLHSFLAFELPKYDSNIVAKLPSPLRMLKVEEKIVEKLREYYKCSEREGLMYFNLLKTIAESDTLCVYYITENCGFSKKEKEFLGIKKPEKVKVQVVKTAGLLDF